MSEGDLVWDKQSQGMRVDLVHIIPINPHIIPPQPYNHTILLFHINSPGY